MSALPPPVRADGRAALRAYWRDRARQHTQDSYAGIPLSKFPEDLRTYEHLVWDGGVDTVIELGVQFGGSALWFRDRLAAFARYADRPAPHVIAVDLELDLARSRLARADPGFARHVDLVEGDVRDPDLPERVAERLRPGARCLVVEDSAHEYDTTLAALTGFARFVPPGGHLVVEDGIVDVEELRVDAGWPRGVLPALHDWIASGAGSDFEIRRDLELYGVTCHPHGFLRRRG